MRAGKARYIGASSMFAWQLSKALHISDRHGWTRLVSMQDHYNLLNREEEREMLPLCADEGLGVIPWSPLARGRLTRPWDEVTERSRADEFGKRLYDTAATDRVIVERVAQVAQRLDVPRARVALAWLLPSRWSPPRSSVPASPGTSRTPWRRWRSGSASRASPSWRSPTSRTRSSGWSEPAGSHGRGLPALVGCVGERSGRPA